MDGANQSISTTAAFEDDTVFPMMVNRMRQHPGPGVADPTDEIIIGDIAMADAPDVQVDDRPFIEDTGDVLGGAPIAACAWW